MLRKNLILLIDKPCLVNEKREFLLSEYIYGSFEPDDVLPKLIELIKNCKTSYRSELTSVKNLTLFGIIDKIRLNKVKDTDFEFKPILFSNGFVKDIVRNIYIVNVSETYGNFTINTKQYNGKAREIIVPPNTIMVISATHNVREIDFDILERIDLSA